MLGSAGTAEMPPNVTVTLGKRMELQKPGPGASMHTLGSGIEDKRPLNIQARVLGYPQ